MQLLITSKAAEQLLNNHIINKEAIHYLKRLGWVDTVLECISSRTNNAICTLSVPSEIATLIALQYPIYCLTEQ